MTIENTPIADSKRRHGGRWVALTIAWLIAVAAATSVDRALAIWVHTSGIEQAIRGKWFTHVLRFPGNFFCTLVVALVFLVLEKARPWDAVFILLAGVMSGINWLIKWLVGRTRPYRLTGPDTPYPFRLQPLLNGISGLVHQTNLSFPSGDMCIAIGLATSVALVKPKWGSVFFVLAAIVGAERILENAHYLSDVLGAIGVGVMGTFFVRWGWEMRWRAPRGDAEVGHL